MALLVSPGWGRRGLSSEPIPAPVRNRARAPVPSWPLRRLPGPANGVSVLPRSSCRRLPPSARSHGRHPSRRGLGLRWRRLLGHSRLQASHPAGARVACRNPSLLEVLWWLPVTLVRCPSRGLSGAPVPAFSAPSAPETYRALCQVLTVHRRRRQGRSLQQRQTSSW